MRVDAKKQSPAIMTLRRSPRDRRRRLVAKMRSIVAATARNAACFVLGSGDPRFDHRLPGFAVQHGLVALRDLDRGEPVAYMRGARRRARGTAAWRATRSSAATWPSKSPAAACAS